MSGLSKSQMVGSGHYNIGSNSKTNFSQGGGSKKAGFPYQIGRSWQTSIAFDAVDPVHGQCCRLNNWNTTIFPLARQSRPIGSRYSANYSYWHIPGVGN